MSDNNLKLDVSNKIATITLNRPEKLNVLSKKLLLELKDCLLSLSDPTEDIRGAILIGSGNKAFSAGGDIKLMNKLDSKGGRELSRIAQSVTLILEKLPIPVIACVDGFALGGGCELAISCDFIYATKQSKFGQPEVKIGLIPGFGGNVRLKRLVGPAIAKELIYTGRQILAKEALEIGLVNKVLDNREELLNTARTTLNEIINNSQFAIDTAKKLFRDLDYRPVELALETERKVYGSLFDHPDKIEGIQAFLDKRKPNF